MYNSIKQWWFIYKYGLNPDNILLSAEDYINNVIMKKDGTKEIKIFLEEIKSFKPNFKLPSKNHLWSNMILKAETGDFEVFTLLLEHIEKDDYFKEELNKCYQEHYERWNYIHWPESTDLRLVKGLHKLGCDPNDACISYYYRSLGEIRAKRINIIQVELIYDNHDTIDYFIGSKCIEINQQMLGYCRSFEMIKKLCDYGFETNGITSLCIPTSVVAKRIKKDDFKGVKEILSLKGNDFKNSEINPLEYAISSEMCDYLVSEGARVTKEDLNYIEVSTKSPDVKKWVYDKQLVQDVTKDIEILEDHNLPARLVKNLETLGDGVKKLQTLAFEELQRDFSNKINTNKIKEYKEKMEKIGFNVEAEEVQKKIAIWAECIINYQAEEKEATKTKKVKQQIKETKEKIEITKDMKVGKKIEQQETDGMNQYLEEWTKQNLNTNVEKEVKEQKAENIQNEELVKENQEEWAECNFDKSEDLVYENLDQNIPIKLQGSDVTTEYFQQSKQQEQEENGKKKKEERKVEEQETLTFYF